ncbi:MAG TPA: signal peptidase II [Kineosporiaceae bacterium]|nr:signal peptidase II [Kineosporiaceae bacterium]
MDDTPAATDQPQISTHRHLPLVVIGIAALVLLADQLTKAWAVSALTGRNPVNLVGSLLRLNLIRNSGAAFSFATGMTWIFTLIATVVAVVIIRLSRRLGSVGWSVALGLLLGGALGNLVDRLFRAPGFAVGHVVDFLELPHWPVFNVADSCIVASAVLIGLLGLRGIGADGSRISG